jgi:hypothetical protein
MGGKETSGSVYSPPRTPRPPRAPISRPPSVRRWWRSIVGRLRDLDWHRRLEEFIATSPYIDYLYAVGVLAVIALAAYILAFG